MAMKLDNVVVRTITNMGIEGFDCVMGRNLKEWNMFQIFSCHLISICF